MDDTNDQIEMRRDKLSKLQDLGVDPYPYKYEKTHSIDEFLESFESLAQSGEEVSLAGRLISKRVMGKASFAHLMDRRGRLQLYLQRDHIVDEGYKVFKTADLGDWIGVKGTAFTTKTGERSLQVKEFTHLCKSLRPLPNMKEAEGVQFSALSDVEARYRHRYLDLIVNAKSREVFETRSRLIRSMRKFLDERDFLEVETPVLQPLYGGANAKPFTTHHNALSSDFYLRISDELYLKRLIVGGFERVYEIGHNFRNEGIDRNHNPEFTAIEFYAAYLDYLQGMDLIEEFYRTVIKDVTGTLQVTWEDQTIDFAQPFARLSMVEALQERTGLNVLAASTGDLLSACQKHAIEIDPKANWGQCVDELFGELIEPELVQPTFVVDYPKAISPLAKRHREDGDNLVERFELFIAGMEFSNAFSELNDPDDQRRRFEAQTKLAQEGDEEAQILDEDYLMALEYGLPPTFGFGAGIDRFTMLLTNQPSIKDVILFPTLKPQS